MRRVPLIAVTLVLRRFSYSFATDRLFYEHKVWSTFELRYKAVCNTKEETNRLIGHRYTDSHFVLADVPASRIHEVTGEGMVDYCLTDPPYSDAIRFLDLSTLWAAWLDLPITEQDRRTELLIDTRQKKVTVRNLNASLPLRSSQSRAHLKRTAGLLWCISIVT
jgi:adenine-specific DNA methylase